MQVVINPGTGPVAAATLENAQANMQALISDLALNDVQLHRDTDCEKADRGGRFLFNLILDDRTSEILMPGLPVDRVRFLGSEGQNIWDFPRLYVDGSSWVWKYAVNVAQRHLTDSEDDD